MNAHEHPHHDRDHAPDAPAPAPLTPEDAGSQALSDALRSSFLIVRFIMIVMVVLFFASGFFTVGPQERAVKLRFGKPVGEGQAALLGPGAHWSWPAPIDEVVKIPFSQVQSVQSSAGWYAVTPEQEALKNIPEAGPTLDPMRDGYLLTGDANIIHVRATLRYRITDPLRYIFAFRDTPVFVTDALDNALFFAAAQFNVDDALTRNITAFSEKVAKRINDLSVQEQLGIVADQVTLTPIAPRQLTEKFRAALEASVRSERVMNEALSYQNEAMSRAGGEAAVRRGLAESDRTRLVEAVAAEAKRFSDVLPKYRENPALFTRFWQAETVQRVFTNAQERIYIAGRADGRPRTLRLDLSREPMKPKAAPEALKGDGH